MTEGPTTTTLRRPGPFRVPTSLAAVALMTALAFVVSADNPATRADADVITWVTDWRTPLVVDIGHALSLLGNILVLGPLAIIAAVAPRVASKPQQSKFDAGTGAPRPPGSTATAFLPALALTAAALSNPLIKLAVGRPRPPSELAEAIESSSGFPSGHSAQSLAFWIGLAMVIALQSPHPRRWLAGGATIALLVGLSRIVLGVHSPTDLLGGWSLGLACVLLSAVALRVGQAHTPRP